VAINEHSLAAGEFARAAAITHSHEASRTLKLLERHHQRLSELLQASGEDVDVDDVEPVGARIATVSNENKGKKESRKPQVSRDARRSKPNAFGPTARTPGREMSSSIANNLASARGIRTTSARHALSPSVTTLRVEGNVEHSQRWSARAATQAARVGQGIPDPISSRAGWTPPVSLVTRADARVTPSKVEKTTSSAHQSIDQGFQRFYNGFESILSKISAPLAFASLPLVADDHPATAEAGAKASQASSVDISRLISKSALRASNQNFGTESFYVVPTAGHTVSYANILSFAEKEKRRNRSTGLDARQGSRSPEDTFVDALEFKSADLGPASPRKGGFDKERRVEELAMENQSMKGIIDTLTQRLEAFQLASQQSTLAMQESMRFKRSRSSSPAVRRHHGSLVPTPATTTTSDVSDAAPDLTPTRDLASEVQRLRAELAALEQQRAAETQERERAGRENEKLSELVRRYRERWDVLKKGAKSRREAGEAARPQRSDTATDK
jgi:hypothetical protein